MTQKHGLCSLNVSFCPNCRSYLESCENVDLILGYVQGSVSEDFLLAAYVLLRSYEFALDDREQHKAGPL